MQCNRCKTRLLIFNSRQTSTVSRYREYVCPTCKRVFFSIESIDFNPVKKKKNIDAILARLERRKKNE